MRARARDGNPGGVRLGSPRTGSDDRHQKRFEEAGEALHPERHLVVVEAGDAFHHLAHLAAFLAHSQHA